MKTLQTEKIFTTPFFSIIKQKIDIGKKKVDFYNIERPGVVIILSFYKNNMVLVDHYRYSIDGFSLELPAGTMQKDESPESCARRELKEETGFSAKKISKIYSFYPSNGISNQCFHICVAEGLSKGSSSPEADEILKVVLLPKEAVVDKIRSNSITDGRTIIAVLLDELNKLKRVKVKR